MADDYALCRWKTLTDAERDAIRAEVRSDRPDLAALADDSWVLGHACLMLVRSRLSRREPLTSLIPADNPGEGNVPF